VHALRDTTVHKVQLQLPLKTAPVVIIVQPHLQDQFLVQLVLTINLLISLQSLTAHRVIKVTTVPM